MRDIEIGMCEGLPVWCVVRFYTKQDVAVWLYQSFTNLC